jgi:hypothetical protein
MCIFISNCISLFNKVVGLLGVYTVFDLNLDAVGEPSFKQSTYKLYLFFSVFVFIVVDLPSKGVVGGHYSLGISHFIIVLS